MVEIAFWVFLAVVFLVGVSYDSIVVGVAALIMIFSYYGYFEGVDIVGWILANFGTVLVLLAAYAAAGGIWSVVKWRLWLRTQEPAIAAAWAGFKKNRVSANTSEAELASIRQSFHTERNDWTGAANKRRITSWIAWWPASILWTFLPMTILLVVVQEMVNRMGVVTGKGLADLIRECAAECG